MRRNRLLIGSAFAALMFIFASMLNAYAVTVDGKNGRDEWSGSGCLYFIKAGDESNCDISFAKLLFYIDDDSNRLYLAIEGNADKEIDENGLSGVDIYFNNEQAISAYPNSELNVFDTYFYSLDSAFIYNKITGYYFCEMCIGIKFGVPSTLCMGIRLYDGFGIASNYYTMTLRTPADQTNTNDGGAEKTSTTRVTTTKSTTTKAVTTTATTKRTTTTTLKTVYTTVAYKPVDLFKTTTATTSSAARKTTKAADKNKTTTKAAKREKTTTLESGSAEITSAQVDAALYALTDIVPFDSTEAIGTLSVNESLTENEALEAYKRTSRKKTIGIAAAAALLTAAVIDAVITGGFKKRRKKDDETQAEPLEESVAEDTPNEKLE